MKDGYVSYMVMVYTSSSIKKKKERKERKKRKKEKKERKQNKTDDGVALLRCTRVGERKAWRGWPAGQLLLLVVVGDVCAFLRLLWKHASRHDIFQ